MLLADKIAAFSIRMKPYLHLCMSGIIASGECGYVIIEINLCTLLKKGFMFNFHVVFCLLQLYLCSPHSSSSELSPQSSTLLQTWSMRRHTWLFLQRNGLVGGQGSFAADEKTQKANEYDFQKKKLYGILYEKTMKYSLLGKRQVVPYKICINKPSEWQFNPPHMSTSSSELSPQSSLPSHTHVWSLHKVLLQMNSSARQKKAPAITKISDTSPDFYD